MACHGPHAITNKAKASERAHTNIFRLGKHTRRVWTAPVLINTTSLDPDLKKSILKNLVAYQKHHVLLFSMFLMEVEPNMQKQVLLKVT